MFPPQSRQQQPFNFDPTQQVQGPFTNMLRGESTTPQYQPTSGYANKFSQIANIATNFMTGVEKGRVKSYEREQQERAKEWSVVQNSINQKLQDPNLTTEGRQAIEREGQQAYARLVLGSDEGKGKKGKEEPQGMAGHIGGVLKQIALGMVGGEMPKKGDKIDPMEVMAKIDTIAGDKKYNKNVYVQGMMKTIQDKIAILGPNPTQEQILKQIGPELAQLRQQVPEQYQDLRENILGSAMANSQMKDVVLQDPADQTKSVPALEGPDHKFYDRQTMQLLPGKQGWEPRPPGFQPREEPMVRVEDDKGNVTYVPRNQAGGKAAPSPGLVKVEHPDGSVTYESKGEAKGKEAPTTGLKAITGSDGKPLLVRPGAAVGERPAPPAARGTDTQAQANKRFQQILDKEAAARHQLEGWYSKATEAIRIKSAAGLSTAVGQLPKEVGDLALQGNWAAVDQWLTKEKVRRSGEITNEKNVAVDQANHQYYPQMYTGGQGGTEAPPETRGAPAGAMSQQDYDSWTSPK